MKLLIAGYGSIGRRHFRNLLRLGRNDVMFFRTHKSSLDDHELADYVVETDLEAALDYSPDAVIIANPTALHLDVAIPAASRGCHLLIEKPLSHSMDGIDTLQRLASDHAVKVLMGFQFRFHPQLQLIKRMVDEQTVGSPLSVRSHWGEYLPNWHPWEDYRKGYSARKDLGGGVILTLCHPLDYLRWLFGEVIEQWSLVGMESDLGIDVADTAEIGLRFQSGVIGSVHLNYTQQPPRHTMEIVCTDGTIRWDYHENKLKFITYPGSRGSDGDPWQIDTLHDFERNQLFLSEMEHFLEVVKGNVAPICGLEDGIRVLEIALQARQN